MPSLQTSVGPSPPAPFHSSQTHSVHYTIKAFQICPDLEPISQMLPNTRDQVPHPLWSLLWSGRGQGSLCPVTLGWIHDQDTQLAFSSHAKSQQGRDCILNPISNNHNVGLIKVLEINHNHLTLQDSWVGAWRRRPGIQESPTMAPHKEPLELLGVTGA